MSMTERGLFVTFEGGEGSGKSTQMRLLAARLRALGRSVVETVEPGGTRIGSAIRAILLDSANRELSATAELLLYFASRNQNVEELIVPALARGAIVLSDRFTDSSTAYQGFARGLGRDTVLDLDRISCRGLVPDLTLLVDIGVEQGLERVRGRNLGEKESRMDAQSLEFHRKVRQAYLEMAAREPLRFRVINGSGGVDEVASAVWQAVCPLIGNSDV
jgi:dTMP kinase